MTESPIKEKIESIVREICGRYQISNDLGKILVTACVAEGAKMGFKHASDNYELEITRLRKGLEEIDAIKLIKTWDNRNTLEYIDGHNIGVELCQAIARKLLEKP